MTNKEPRTPIKVYLRATTLRQLDAIALPGRNGRTLVLEQLIERRYYNQLATQKRRAEKAQSEAEAPPSKGELDSEE